MENESKPTLDTKVWVLMGPDAQHGDGIGTKGVYATEEDAKNGMEYEMDADIDYVHDGDWTDNTEAQIAIGSSKELPWQRAWEVLQPFMNWPHNIRGYHIEERDLRYLGVTQEQLDQCAICGQPTPGLHVAALEAGRGEEHRFTAIDLGDVLEELNDA